MVEGSLHSLQSALEQRQEAAAARTKLQLMQDTVHLAAKVSVAGMRTAVVVVRAIVGTFDIWVCLLLSGKDKHRL